jgi:CheY-like chemotaxis protein
MKILVVEDSESNYVYFEAVLKYNGYDYLLAKNGQEAIDIFKANSNDIGLIFMDLKMPVKNGYESFDEIKQIDSEVPVIAQTAHAMSGDKDKCLAYGFVDYIAKPFDPNQLTDIIEKHMRKA